MADRPRFPSYGSTDVPPVVVVDSSFPSAEFSTMCDNISSNIYLIHNSTTNLDSVLRQLQSDSYTVALQNRILDIQDRTNPIVNTTTGYLLKVAELSLRGEKQHKFLVDRLKNKYEECIKKYSKLQTQVAAKIRTAILKSEAMSPPSDWTSEEDNERAQLLEEKAKQKQKQEQVVRELESEHSFMLEREQRIKHIESEIIDANQVMRKLAEMVHEQGEIVDTLEDHVESAADNVERGATQLHQASVYQKKYRKKLCCFLLLLLILGVIIAIIVIVQTS